VPKLALLQALSEKTETLPKPVLLDMSNYTDVENTVGLS
jgi:hypothetical protein